MDLQKSIRKILKEELSKNDTKFKNIYSTMWSKMMKQVCLKYTKDTNKAEDFCQNGFIKVYQNLNKYDESGSLEGWVRRVINNSILDELRKEKMSFVDKGDDGFDFSKLDMSDEEYDESEFNIEDVKKILPKLPPSYRTVFKLFYFDELSHQDIAKKLGISPNTSKTNLMKARAKIKSLLQK